jgi:sugar O-acyltransferase (sialic acid O-acetyltransferase NeuD family)
MQTPGTIPTPAKTGPKVVIFGTASFAEVAHFYLTHDSHYEVVAFTASADSIQQDSLQDLPVVPFETLETFYPPDEYQMFIAIGYAKLNKVRERFYNEAKAKGYTLITYISSQATYWGTPIGDNCFVFEDNTIQAFTTIGNNVILWSGNHIGHHTTIEDHCFITSHVLVSGHVTIGSHCFLGVNATLRDSISIAPECVIGAGALVLKNTSPKEVYAAERTKIYPKDSSNIF